MGSRYTVLVESRGGAPENFREIKAIYHIFLQYRHIKSIGGGGGVLTQKNKKKPVATPKSANWHWLFLFFLAFFGFLKFPNWHWFFFGFFGFLAFDFRVGMSSQKNQKNQKIPKKTKKNQKNPKKPVATPKLVNWLGFFWFFFGFFGVSTPQHSSEN